VICHWRIHHEPALAITRDYCILDSRAHPSGRTRLCTAPELLRFRPVVVFFETALKLALLVLLVSYAVRRRASRAALAEAADRIRSLITRRAS
jgi:hypothetical protein